MRSIYVCHDTIQGIFSALYDAWVYNRHADVGIEFVGKVERQLFCQYIDVVENEKKVLAVERLIQKNLGENTYHDIYYALLADDAKKAEAVFQTMQAARALRNSRKIMEHLSNDSVTKVFELSRRVGNEAHLFQGFVRFRELQGGVLFSEIAPKSQVLTCIADYFYNRYPMENWMIHDKTHGMSLVHPKQKPWFLLTHDQADLQQMGSLIQVEDDYEDLWKTFFQSISIQERENYCCQRTHLPLRYRKEMVEFHERKVDRKNIGS